MPVRSAVRAASSTAARFGTKGARSSAARATSAPPSDGASSEASGSGPKSYASPFSSTFTPATFMEGSAAGSSGPEEPARASPNAEGDSPSEPARETSCAAEGLSADAPDASAASDAETVSAAGPDSARSAAAASSAILPESGRPQSLQNRAPSRFSEWQ